MPLIFIRVALATALSSNGKLQKLDIGPGNPDVSAEAVSKIAKAMGGGVCRLTSLDLSAVDLRGEEGAEALASLSPLQHLKQLCLLGTRIGNQGATGFATCLAQGGFSAIEDLSLSACNLDLDDGLSVVLAALRAGHAGNLTVRQRSSGAEFAIQRPPPQVLECGANPACQEERMASLVLELREARPGLRIHWNAGDEAANMEQAAAASSDAHAGVL